METAGLQLDLFRPPEPKPVKRPRSASHLAEPLSREEQRRFGRLYAANVRLVRKFAGRLRQQYGHCVATEDINSCCDLAFIKACRAWDPDRGALSTIYWRFAHGEVLHFLRGNNWGISATHRARQLGLAARRLMDAGMSVDAVCRELACSAEDIRLALVATAGMAHDTMGFDLHVCDRPTPWEVLEACEAT
jgi:DNA-directed RNA polymerase specialized sigma subunit